MHTYCKAFLLKDLRPFPGWHERPGENGHPLPEQMVCYIWDDFTVVDSPLREQSIIFDQITPEWKTFCTTQLHFKIPEELHSSRS